MTRRYRHLVIVAGLVARCESRRTSPSRSLDSLFQPLELRSSASRNTNLLQLFQKGTRRLACAQRVPGSLEHAPKLRVVGLGLGRSDEHGCLERVVPARGGARVRIPTPFEGRDV